MEAEPKRRDEIPERLAQEMDRDELSRMVREANERGLSYQDMADRSQRAGHPVSKPYFQKLATNLVVQAPNPERLRGIAAAIDAPIRMVKKAAAAQYLQYDSTELSGYGDDVRVIVAHLGDMDGPDQRKWRAMIEAAERARED